jgi:hypothetical protein
VLRASLVWGLVTWLGVMLIGRRASKSKALFFSSAAITRFVIGSIGFVISLIIGSLAYAIRAFLAPG